MGGQGGRGCVAPDGPRVVVRYLVSIHTLPWYDQVPCTSEVDPTGVGTTKCGYLPGTMVWYLVVWLFDQLFRLPTETETFSFFY